MLKCKVNFPTLALGALAGASALWATPSALASPGCPADIAPIPNGNAVVNVDDLLAVINGWGICANPNNCPADIAPLGGNDVVNVDDLLAVINGWGNCPVTGPVNNECAGATTVVNGPNAFNNTGATQSLPLPADNGCIFGGPTQVTRDVWFTYTATCTGVATFGTCATTGTFSDTVIVAYDACGGTQLACDDDGCAAASDFLSELSLTVTTGQVIKLRVASWGAGADNQGAGVLTVSCAPFNNDFCSDATTVAIGGNVNGNVTGSTPEANAPPSCNGVSPPVGRWHKVVGTGTTLTASTCGSPSEFWDSTLAVYCGLTCDDLVCVTASGGTNCGPNGLNEQVSWCAAAGQTYLILVGHSFGNPPEPGEGNYNLAITGGAACANPIQCFIPAPANDECVNAVTVNLGANTLNNDGATDSANPGLECAGGGSINAERDIWAKWTATCSGAATFDTCATTSNVSDTIVGVYTACGGTEVGCDEDSCPDTPPATMFNSRVSASVTAGQQYLVRIASYAGSPNGSIVLTISCDSSVVCGNGIQEAGEGCDDGNTNAGDGCFGCQVETPAFPCVGTSEGFPCLVDGTNPATDPNAGCNVVPPAFASEIFVNQAICGQTSSYLTNTATQARDTDWYKFTPLVTGNYQIVLFMPLENPALLVITNGTPDITTCGALTVTGNGLGTASVPLVFNQTLTAGTTYAIFASRPSLVTQPVPPSTPCNRGLYSLRIRLQP